MKRVVPVFVVAVLLALFSAGCASNGKSITGMSPKEKAAFAMSMYNSAFDDYKFQFEQMSAGGLDGKEKEFLSGYLKTLENSYRAIGMYNHYAASGTTATPEAEAALVAAVRELTALLAKGGK